MKYTVSLGQIVLLQVCLCLLLVSLSDEQHANQHGKTGRLGKRVKLRRPNSPRAPRNRKGAHAQYTLLPWVEPPETCGRRPIVERRFPEATNASVEPGFGGVYPSQEPSTPRAADNRQVRRKTGHCDNHPWNSDNQDGFYPSYVLVTKTTDSDELLPEWRWRQSEVVCGGALVGKNVVVTAAHCVDKAYLRGVNVTVGLNSPNQTEKRVIEVEKVWFHPEACNEATLQLMDFAILILKNNVTYSHYIQPACFQPNFYHPLNWELFNVPYATLGMDCYQSYINHNFYLRDCNNLDPGYKWLRLSHQCYRSTTRFNMCGKQFGAPLYYVGRDSSGYDNRHVIAGLASFLSAPRCEENRENGSYFFDFYRARQSIPLSLSDSVPIRSVNSSYSTQGCFLPKRRINVYNNSANFDDLFTNGVPKEIKADGGNG